MPLMRCTTHPGRAIALPSSTSHHLPHGMGEIAMAESDSATTRRSMIQAVGLGVGAMLTGVSNAVAAASPPEVTGADYWAHKAGSVELSLYRKRIAPAPGAPPQ